MKWNKNPIDSILVREIAQRYNISLIESSVLVRRNITSGKDILFFLEDDFVYLNIPFLFKDMELAIERVKQASLEKETVLVYGDRDVDGIMSTTITVHMLELQGITALWKVPLSALGYGLSKDDIDDAHAQGATLIITVDCGISSIQECEYAMQLGIDVIIVDHHIPGAELPNALAIINPKVAHDTYPFDGMCATALALKFHVALAISNTEIYNNEVVLMNIVPLRDGQKFELLCVRNLCVQWRKAMIITPENASYQCEEFVELLQGKQILVYDQQVQHRLFQEIFPSVDIYTEDLQILVNKYYKKLQGMSLMKIGTHVHLTNYLDNELEEIDLFFQLYKSIIYTQYPRIKESCYEMIDLVAIATIADLMPLRNENRILYKMGIKKLNTEPNKNLTGLLSILSIKPTDKINSRAIGWKIAPAINSSGRMGEADKSVKLLLTKDKNEIPALAQDIVALNQQRKKQMDMLKEKIRKDVEHSLEENKTFVLVYNEDLLHSFTGIVAGRYSREYGIPVVILAKRDNSVCSGSVRCPASFNAPQMIGKLNPLLIDGGGHKAAAGFSFLEEHKEEIISSLHGLLAQGTSGFEAGKEEEIVVDVEIPEKYFNPQELTVMHKKFEPYGQEWGTVYLLFTSISVHSCETLGAHQDHLKFILRIGQYKVPAILWQYAQRQDSVETFYETKKINVICEIKVDEFQGLEQFTLIIKDYELL